MYLYESTIALVEGQSHRVIIPLWMILKDAEEMLRKETITYFSLLFKYFVLKGSLDSLLVV